MSVRDAHLYLSVSVVLTLIWTSTALGDGPLFPGAQYPVGEVPTSVAIGPEVLPPLIILESISIMNTSPGSGGVCSTIDNGEAPLARSAIALASNTEFQIAVSSTLPVK